MAHILVVEDTPVVREPIVFALDRLGHSTEGVANGQDALSAMARQTPDLVLLDLHMEGMDGLKLLAHMRADPRLADVPVIVLTVDGAKETVLAAQRLRVRHYMLKSRLDFGVLVERINAIVSERDHPAAPPSPADHETPSQPPAANAVPRPTPADPKAALQSLKPMVKRSDLAERLDRCNELQAVSPAVSEVLALTRNSSSSLDAIAKAIKRDPTITLKVLRLANSTAFSRGDVVDSVDKAVLRIGAGAIGQAVMNIGIVEQFGGTRLNAITDPRFFWEHSIGVALIASRIAAETGSAAPETAFTLGLIHDLGRLVLDSILGETYAAVMRAAAEAGLPLERAESRMLLLNHAEAMERILRAWRFPRELADPVMHHHLSVEEIRQKSPSRFGEIATVALADRLAHAMLLGSSGNEAIYPTGEFAAALHLSPGTIEQLEKDIHDRTAELKLAMLMSGPGAPTQWPAFRDSLTRRFSGHVNPLFIGPEPATDAYRLFCAAINSGGQPNLAVVHAPTPKDRGAMLGLLGAREAEAGVGPLPILLMQPDGPHLRNEITPPGRTLRSLTTPFTLDRFFAAASELTVATPQRKAA